MTLNDIDIMGKAQTGTGKTIAFLLATLNYLIKKSPPPNRKINQPRAVILAPTRELARQIHQEAEILAKYTDIKLGLCYGGTGYQTQQQVLAEGIDILIGTPGRIIDFFKQDLINFKVVQVMVLDEADRMLDLGFIKDIRYLLRRMSNPEARLNMLFSATLSLRITELSYEHMNNPREVSIEPQQVTASKIKESIYFPSNEEKIPLLFGLLAKVQPERTIIFVNTKRVADRIWRYLEGNGLNAAQLSGDVPQNKRQSLLNQFQQGELKILVATDVAARGLHIPAVSHIINFDLSQDAEDYVHRIGRTARAGASGEAISFACEEFSFSVHEIEEFIGHKIPIEKISDDLLVKPKPAVAMKPTPKKKGRPSSGHKQTHPGKRKEAGSHKRSHGKKISK